MTLKDLLDALEGAYARKDWKLVLEVIENLQEGKYDD